MRWLEQRVVATVKLETAFCLGSTISQLENQAQHKKASSKASNPESRDPKSGLSHRPAHHEPRLTCPSCESVNPILEAFRALIFVRPPPFSPEPIHSPVPPQPRTRQGDPEVQF